MNITLISCVKQKQAAPTQARGLYVSQLFKAMRSWAELNSTAWFILSAEHGLVKPDQVLAPYDTTLVTMPSAQRLVWAHRVQHQLASVLLPGDTVTILAGRKYREHLVPWLQAHGWAVNVPMEGLGIGQQKQWLKRNT